jgi:hypothetical protein
MPIRTISLASSASQMTDTTKNENRDAVFGWEDDGGAQQSDARRQTGTASAPGERRRSDQQRLDASHDSDARGEHRYNDAQQTEAEQEARQVRDDLKRRLEGRATRRAR